MTFFQNDFGIVPIKQLSVEFINVGDSQTENKQAKESVVNIGSVSPRAQMTTQRNGGDDINLDDHESISSGDKIECSSLENLRLDIDYSYDITALNKNYNFKFDHLKNVSIKFLNVFKYKTRKQSNGNILSKILYQDYFDCQPNTTIYANATTPTTKKKDHDDGTTDEKDVSARLSSKTCISKIERMDISCENENELSINFLFSNVFMLDLVSYKHLKYVRIGKLAQMKSFSELIDGLKSFDKLYQIILKNIGNYSNNIIDVDSDYNLHLEQLFLNSCIEIQSSQNSNKLISILTEWYKSNIVYVCIGFICHSKASYNGAKWLTYTSNWVQSLIASGKRQVNQSIRPIEIISNGIKVDHCDDHYGNENTNNNRDRSEPMSQMFIEENQAIYDYILHITIAKVPRGKQYTSKVAYRYK